MLQVGQGYQSYQGSNGAPGWAKPAAGAAAGGTVILLAARRRRKKKREAEARTIRGRAKQVAGTVAKEAVPAATKGATVVAAKAGPVAKGAQERVAHGLDRVAEDRKVRTYAIAGAALVWILISWSELRQLRKLNKRVASGRSF